MVLGLWGRVWKILHALSTLYVLHCTRVCVIWQLAGRALYKQYNLPNTQHVVQLHTVNTLIYSSSKYIVGSDVTLMSRRMRSHRPRNRMRLVSPHSTKMIALVGGDKILCRVKGLGDHPSSLFIAEWVSNFLRKGCGAHRFSSCGDATQLCLHPAKLVRATIHRGQ